MRISVIVPLYNYANYIGDCIQSILNQTYKNFEIIVVDDCSTDGSLSVAKQYESSTVKILQTPANSGYSVAKNTGIMASTGELITCLDADDMLTKDSLAVRAERIQRKNADLVHGLAMNIDSECTLEKAYASKAEDGGRRKGQNTLHAQTVMVRRHVYKRFGLYDITLRSASDREMWYRLFGWELRGPNKVTKTKVDRDVAYYRLHYKSMSAIRKRDKSHNDKIIDAMTKQWKMRYDNGITAQNTLFLRK